MAAHAKRPGTRFDAQILTRCTKPLKDKVDAMCLERFGNPETKEPGTEEGSLSALVRNFLDEEVKRWEASKKEAR